MSYSTVIIVGLCVSFVQGAVISNPKTNSALEDYMIKTLEKFSGEIKGGKQVLGLPALDPMALNTFNYSLTNGPIGFRIDIGFNNGTLTGISNNEVSATAWDGSTNVLTTKMMFPTIQMKATYSMDGNMFSFFPLVGHGTTIILASNTYITSRAAIKKTEKGLSMQDMKLTFNEPRVKSTFVDTIRRGQFSGISSELLNAMGPQIFQNILKPLIASSMTEQLQAYINREFSTADVNELLPNA